MESIAVFIIEITIAALALIGALVGGIFAFKAAATTSNQGLVASLTDRLKHVEDRLSQLERDLHVSQEKERAARALSIAAFAYIERLLLWIIDMAPTESVPPIPTELQEHVTIPTATK